MTRLPLFPAKAGTQAFSERNSAWPIVQKLLGPRFRGEERERV
jgi:hypothetical protein